MIKLIAKNPTAKHNYFIEDTIETGIVLSGTEIKSIRNGKVNLKDSYAGIKDLLKDSIIYCQSESKSKLSTGKPPFLNIVNIF